MKTHRVPRWKTRTLRTWWLILLPALLAGCGDVKVGAESRMPKPLIEPMPVTVGVYYSDAFRVYEHSEERWGTEWKVSLGPYHVRMIDELTAAAFRQTVPIKDLSSVPAEPAVSAILEPIIEQYSFITPRDTGAKYFAVTIRYRLNVFTPDGKLADSLTFTGYGSESSGGMTSTAPMMLATRAAMRDAAAKFLVQFPEQAVAQRLVTGQPLIEQPAVAAATSANPAGAVDDLVIETVPIRDSSATVAGQPPVQPAAAPPAAAPTDSVPQSAPTILAPEAAPEAVPEVAPAPPPALDANSGTRFTSY